jgi:tetratricopeptide (TPR) repeat protein
VFLSLFLCGPDGLARNTADAEVCRDDPPRLEYRAARHAGSGGVTARRIERWLESPGGTAVEGVDRDEVASIQRLNLADVTVWRLVRRFDSEEPKDWRLLEEAIRLNPLDLEVNRRLGQYYAAQGAWPRARERFEQVVALAPYDASALAFLGLVYSMMGNHIEAVRRLRRALEREPDNARTWTNLGQAYAAQGALDDAAACFTRALELDPTLEAARHNLERCRRQR